jgi:hypothetical protein
LSFDLGRIVAWWRGNLDDDACSFGWLELDALVPLVGFT